MNDSTIQRFNDSTRKGVALALDLGTTTLAGRLLGDDGAVLAEARLANPQRALGADILSRLQLAEAGEGAELQRLLVDGVRTLVAELLAQAGCSPEQIVAAAAAGNPGICHLLLDLPVDKLLFPPHRTPLNAPVMLGLNILFGGADHASRITDHESSPHPSPLTPHVTLFPAVSGFVGGDLLADLFGISYGAGLGVESLNCAARVESLKRLQPMTEGLDSTAKRSAIQQRSVQRFNSEAFNRDAVPFNSSTHEGRALVLDLGTNAELALCTGTQWLATSAAAGPAFEAGNIACGMPLAAGAVTDVRISDDRLALTVFGGGRPVGLSGSGLLALVAAAREGGLIAADGRIVAPEEVGTNLARYLVADGAGWAICFHRDARLELRLTQDDVRQLQLAKGAVRAGIEVLLDRAGLAPAQISTVLITGAFGSALPATTVKGIALLPESMLDKLVSVPNGVLDGLAAFLADPHGPERLKDLHATIKPLPLSGTPAFEKRFLGAMEF